MSRSLTFVIAVAAGCGLLPTENGRVVPAVLQHHQDGPVINVPSSVQRDVPFNVEFRTYSGGCTEPGTNHVIQRGMAVEIRATQRDISRTAAACPDILRITENVVTMQFANAGAATIRVTGRQVPGDAPLVLERQVTVTP